MPSSPCASRRPLPRALVCDADEISARMLARALRAEGFEVVTCSTAAACESAMASERPGLVVLSILLPDLDGLALTRRLRLRHPSLRIIATSSLRAEQRALQMGADAFLIKPVAAPQLASLAVSLASVEQDT